LRAPRDDVASAGATNTGEPSASTPDTFGRDSLDLNAQERIMIERALARFRGNRKEAAEALKISTVTLWRKMKQYGLVQRQSKGYYGRHLATCAKCV
jgi:DNA-binding NtrC family response regulator